MTASPLDAALDYAEERNWDLIEIEPNDIDADARTMIRVNAGGDDEMLVEVGWGTAGLYVNIRLFRYAQPVTPSYLGLGEMVTIFPPEPT